MSKKTPIYKTSDFSVACYLFMKHVRLIKYERIPETRNQWTFYFDDDYRDNNGVHIPCTELEIEFVNSESYNFDSAQRSLKKLCMNARRRS